MKKHYARKRFGQHFLQDNNVVAQIVAAINPQLSDHIVEIGPGLGVLTEALLTCVPELDAIELDRDIIPLLTKRCEKLGRLTLYEADALQFDFRTLANDERPLRIVGNLPYNISTPLMFHLIETSEIIHDMHFMLQKEVVNRLAAQPGKKDYGRLSVMMQYYCQVDLLFDVPPESFDPPPKVNSAVVRLVPHINPPVNVANVKILEKVVSQAFSQRRKTLRNTLKPLMSADKMQALGIDPVRRAETLTLDEFAAITNSVFDNTEVKSNKAD